MLSRTIFQHFFLKLFLHLRKHDNNLVLLYLTYYEGYGADDIARILRKTKKQIYNLLHRAKNSLKELLVKEGISHEDL